MKHVDKVTKIILSKINNISSLQASIVITAIGFATFFSGLLNPFMNDDNGQIVNNVLVHSIKNIRLFFEGGTFYGGIGNPLTGIYYRPLMTTTFSLLYSLFGPHPFYFHLLQLIIYIASAIIFFMFLKFFFKPALALFLALVFLVHPLNSQIVYAIPSMQDVLFFFFGILALYLLLRFSSIKSLLLVALCLFLSLLSKETGVAFIALTLLYLFWYDRRRLLPFIGILALPVIIYLDLKFNATSNTKSSGIAQIDNLSLFGRMMTIPTILLFYLYKFIFPLKLATGYYWTYPKFSMINVLLPLIIDLAVLGLIIWAAIWLYRKYRDEYFWIFSFFAIWALIGIALHLQIIPLDMTACDDWFYFPMAGVLGMIGVLLEIVIPRIKPKWWLLISLVILLPLAFRSAIRGHDYSSEYKLAMKDITVSKENYTDYYQISCDLIEQGKYVQAEAYASKSIALLPTAYNYYYLGYAMTYLDNYGGAIKAYKQGVAFNISLNALYDNLANLIVVYGDDNASNNQFFLNTFKLYPKDSTIWVDYALFQSEHNDPNDAKKTISAATLIVQVPAPIYNSIINDHHLTIKMTGLSKAVTIN